MFIIEVIPLANLPPQVPQLLSYFFTKPLLKGAVVEVLIGNRKAPAVVVSSVSVEGEKASLKKSSFQLKKLSGVISEAPLVSGIQLRLALWLSRNYFAPLGMCLKTVLPPFFLKKNYELRIAPAGQADHELKNNLQPASQKPTVMLTEAKDILKNIDQEIKRIIRDKKQVLIVVPEVSTAEYFYERLAGHNETVLVHSKISVKKSHQNWLKISSGEAEVIIGTRQAVFSPFLDLGLIIIEDSSNEAFKSDMSPKYNTFDLAVEVARLYSSGLMMVSGIPSVNEYHGLKTGRYHLKDQSAVGSGKKPFMSVSSMSEEIRAGNFSAFSRESRNKFIEYLRNNRKVLVFSSRKGYFGSLVCENCSFTFKCPNCSIPFRLHKSPDPLFVCHRCSTVQKPPQSCPNCHSYKLKSVGFPGSQRLEEELDHIIKNNGLKTDVFIFDSSSLKTSKSENEMLKKITESESCVCIATQLIFSHRYDTKFDLVIIPGLDSLTTMPDFRSEEHLFRQFIKIMDFNPESVAIQSFNDESPLILNLKDNNYAGFYEQELPARKIFWYPPFARLVKLSYRHKDYGKAGYEARVLSEKLKRAIIQMKLDQSVRVMDPSPAFVEREKGFYIHNIILKIIPDRKPDEILKFVPSEWMIDVDPKTIL